MMTLFYSDYTNKITRLVKILFCCLFFVGLFSTEGFTSHFRYGNISWQATGNPNEVEFTIETAWRSSFGAFPNNISIGDAISLGGSGNFNFGDGNSNTSSLQATVTSINTTEDWFFGVTKLIHTYASTGDFTAFFNSCCRLSNLQNNRDNNYRLETIVNIGSNNSPPVTSLPPIIALQSGQSPATFQFFASDINGDDLQYRLATPSESGGLRNIQPTGLSIDANTGEISWNTSGLTIGNLYTVAVVVEDLDAAGNVKSKTPVDFLIKIVDMVNPPNFIAPTPADGTTFDVGVGGTVAFNVAAEDIDGANNTGGLVTLNAVGQPAGAVFAPAIPTVPGGNPISTMFSWTPTLANVGIVQVLFVATDDLGAQTFSRVNIRVGVPIVTCPADIGPILTPFGSGGASITVTGQSVTGPSMITNQRFYFDDNGTLVEFVPGDAAFFPVGTTTVTYEVTDENNFVSDCSFLVTVEEQISTVTFVFENDLQANNGGTELCNCQEQCVTATVTNAAGLVEQGVQLALVLMVNGTVQSIQPFDQLTDNNGNAQICFTNENDLVAPENMTVIVRIQ